MVEKRAANISDSTEETIKPERFVDLMVYNLAYDAFVSSLEAEGKDPEKDPLANKGFRMAIKYGTVLQQGVARFVLPLASHQDAGNLKPAVTQGMSGSQGILLKHQAKMFRVLLLWLRNHHEASRNLFTGRAAKAVQTAILAINEDDFGARLNKLASIPSLSGLSAPHSWMGAASERLGVSLSPAEEIIRDAETAANAGDDLEEIRGKIQAASPNSAKAAELEEKAQETLQKIDHIAKNSKNPTAVLAAAAVAATSKRTVFRTETGKKLGHTPEQEDAMMARGRTIIAAGAGSGKTRVLASKVAYHINELGVSPMSILATTFTRKAAAELMKRVGAYGAVIEGPATNNFGTTHSIAGKLLNTQARSFRRNKYLGRSEGYLQTTLIRLAMEQVQMKGSGNQKPPAPEGIWSKLFVDQPNAQGVAPSTQEFQDAIDNSIGYFDWAARTWKERGPQSWAATSLSFLKDIKARQLDPSKLTANQKQYLNNLFSKVKGRNPINYRVGGYNPEAIMTASPFERQKLAAPEGGKNKFDKYKFFKTPANQWFNLGLELSEENADGSKTPIPIGEFKNAISILKGKGLSPSEAWAQTPGAHEAVYAAYEWLKGPMGEPDFQSTGDMDDILIDTVKALVADPKLRRQINSQYKVLLIDEAQDLNRVQHLMFGLMAGYLDPQTLEPNADKKMSADTFALIGDDKQAIYEFRGADPEEFINKSNLTPGGDNFETKLLDTNFRSGSQIVAAAGSLIAHNTKQIPMVCKTTDRKGSGTIVSRQVDDVAEAAKIVADEIQGLVESGEVTAYDAVKGSGGYSAFGVAVRSNKEAFDYGLQMIQANIPFKCNVNFFSDRSTKALLGWLTIAEQGDKGDPAIVNKAVLDATAQPLSKLGEAFRTKLSEQTTENYVAYLLQPGAAGKIYGKGGWADQLQVFIDNIAKAMKFKGSPEEILNSILDLKGIDDLSVLQSMVEAVKEDEEAMAELAAEAPNGHVTEEMIEEAALAPIAPLKGLISNQDQLAGAMTYVRKLQNVNAKLSSADTEDQIDRNAVTIGTMHSWKGLEVPNLYLPMVGGKFPRAGKSGVAEAGPALESERRLAYVAITRAEDRCTILDIPHPTMGIRSQFISEACLPVVVEDKPAKTANLMDKWADGPLMAALIAEDYATLASLQALEQGWGEVMS